MDIEMQRKIEAAIKESLPQQVGEVLRLELEKIPKLESKVTDLGDMANTYRAQLEAHKDIATRENALAKEKSDINKREAELLAKENKYDVSIATIRANEAEKRAQGLYDLIKIIFTNPVVTSSMSRNENYGVVPQGQSYHISVPSNVNETRTETLTKP